MNDLPVRLERYMNMLNKNREHIIAIIFAHVNRIWADSADFNTKNRDNTIIIANLALNYYHSCKEKVLMYKGT